MKISIFAGHAPDLCFKRDFSQGIESTQRMHFWIALDLIYNRKLVRSQLNSQILSYDHFSAQKLRKILAQVDAQFLVSPNYSRAVKALRVIYRLSWARFEVILPCNRITLRAEKALRIISGLPFRMIFRHKVHESPGGNQVDGLPPAPSC